MLTPQLRSGNQLWLVLLLFNVVLIGFAVIPIQSFKTVSLLSHGDKRVRRLSTYDNGIFRGWQDGSSSGHGWWYRHRDDGSKNGMNLKGRVRKTDENKSQSKESLPSSNPKASSFVPTSASVPVFSVVKDESWRSHIPLSLQKRGPKTFQKLENGNCTIYVLGTVHSSIESANDVTTLLQHVSPDCIFLELCRSGEHILQSTDNESGNEFRRAYQYWQQRQQEISSKRTNYRNRDRECFLMLGDRPVRISLERIFESLDAETIMTMLLRAFKDLASPEPIPDDDDGGRMLAILNKDTEEIMVKIDNELRDNNPLVHKILVEERDLWMAVKIIAMARIVTPLYEDLRNYKLIASVLDKANGYQPNEVTNDDDCPFVMVVVVGAGHVSGICQHLTNTTITNTKPEDILPPLLRTREWDNDLLVQQVLIPRLIEKFELVADP